MSNVLIQQESWWKLNWKWLVPIIGIMIILIVLFFSSFFGQIFGDYAKAYADPKLYELALEKVKEDERVKEVLGEIEPIDNMTIMNGFVNYSEDNKLVNSTVKIICEKGKAMLDISAERSNETWDYKLITVRIKSPLEKKETIEIISSEE